MAAMLNKIDESSEDRHRALRAAAADNRAFPVYRTRHCEAFAVLAFGGNAQNDQRVACAIELNDRRTESLWTTVRKQTGGRD